MLEVQPHLVGQQPVDDVFHLPIELSVLSWNLPAMHLEYLSNLRPVGIAQFVSGQATMVRNGQSIQHRSQGLLLNSMD